MRWQRSRGGIEACCQDQTMQVMATDSTTKTISYRGDVRHMWHSLSSGSSTYRKLPSQSDSDPSLPCNATMYHVS
jgi:hypothetical protein